MWPTRLERLTEQLNDERQRIAQERQTMRNAARSWSARRSLTEIKPKPKAEPATGGTMADVAERLADTNAPANGSGLIGIKPTLASGWILGKAVLDKSGLWHGRFDDDDRSPSCAHRRDEFADWCQYRRAAPGTKEGDAYDEARYAAAPAEQTKAELVRGVWLPMVDKMPEGFGKDDAVWFADGCVVSRAQRHEDGCRADPGADSYWCACSTGWTRYMIAPIGTPAGAKYEGEVPKC